MITRKLWKNSCMTVLTGAASVALVGWASLGLPAEYALADPPPHSHGGGGGGGGGGGEDTTPPAPVYSLSVVRVTSDSITLTWTATADDGNDPASGPADRYDIRYRDDKPITQGNWRTATQAVGEPSPGEPGSSETFTVNGLSADTLYYLALKVGDEVTNWSKLSNKVLTATAVGSWEIHTVDTGYVGLHTAIALDSSGDPHISYWDGSAFKAKYAKWDDLASTWDIETIPDPHDRVGTWPSLAVDDSNNIVHVLYLDLVGNDDGHLRYAQLTDSGWSFETLDENAGTWNSIVLDDTEDRNPQISYRSFYASGFPGLMYTEWTGSEWLTQEVDLISDGAGVRGTSLALDAGEPRIAYSDFVKGILQYAVWTGSAWEIELVDGVEGVDQLGDYCSLALDASGNPHISYVDFNAGSLKYARGTSWTQGSGWDWQIEVVDGPGLVGPSGSASYTSLALDSAGNAHISYHDFTNGDLKYARWTGSAWDIEVVDDRGSVGSYSSLVLDDLGNPHISYYRAEYGGLKYARKGGGEASGMTCYADCDPSAGIGILDIFDFLCFQNSFVNSEPYACDCDTTTGQSVCDIFDFLCFQDAFVAGCP